MDKASSKKKSATTAASATHILVPQRYIKAKKVALSQFEVDIQGIKELVAKSSANEELGSLRFFSTVISTSLLQALPLIVSIRINQEVPELLNQIHNLTSALFQEIRKTISDFIVREPPTEYSTRLRASTIWKNRCMQNLEELEKVIKKEYFDEKKEYNQFRIRVLILITAIFVPGMIGVMRSKIGYREVCVKMFDNVVRNALGDWEKVLKVCLSKAVIESVNASEKGEEDLSYDDFMWELIKEVEVIQSCDEEEEEELPEKDAAEMIKEEVLETCDVEQEAAAEKDEEEQRKKDLVEMMLPIGGLRITSFDVNDLFRDDDHIVRWESRRS